MKLRSIEHVPIAGKRVLVRVDFNVPMVEDRITDDTRVRAALPTIEHLCAGRAKVVLISHLGRPKGAPSADLSLRPVATLLASLLGRPVTFVPSVVGPEVLDAIGVLPEGGVALLENLRFEPGEEKNDPEFARRLAALADLYVDDAFGAAHRAHASTVGVTAFLPSYAGFLMAEEVSVLARLVDAPPKPFVAILGGAKVSDKIGVVTRLLDKVDTLLIGGGMANTFLLAQGVDVGASLAEAAFVEEACRALDGAAALGVAIILPSDAVVAESIADPGRTVPIGAVGSSAIFDIGPETVAAFSETIREARTVFWNGPMGVFERPAFAEGTRAIAASVAESGAFTVVGGGDSVAAIEQMGLAAKISHISTGGGASLEYVDGRTLPGLAVLVDAPEAE
ncbi:MAG: phosphoglycerate kinase [Thermomicrobiales bacterium]